MRTLFGPELINFTMTRFALFVTAFFASTILYAQHTHFAQFVIKGTLDETQMVAVEKALTTLPDVVQARVGGSANNVVLSSLPGTPILQSEVEALVEGLNFEVMCYRSGVIGQDRILPLTQNCEQKNPKGNIQD